jgi:N-carbamoylputrescine amidase
MGVLTVALLQMASAGMDQETNRAKGETYCRQAAVLGTDIVLFPEMWNIGYTLPKKSNRKAVRLWEQQAIDLDSPFLRHFQTLAKELRIAIGITYLQRWPGKPRNAITLFDRQGKEVLTYAKVHTCEFDAEAAITPGEDFYVSELTTAQGGVQVGAMICFDREFPESARILMLKGAEIVLVPNACEMEQNRMAQLRTRAYENMIGIALTNYAAPQEQGHSIAFDPIAFTGKEGLSRDTTLVEGGTEEGIYLAKFDMNAIRKWRSREVWGNAYRRPRCYSALVDENVVPPFMHKDATR